MHPAVNSIPPSSAAPLPDHKPSVLGGASGRLAPKPVEVTSVPETPVNNSTPAGGSPRPELDVLADPVAEKPKTPEAPVILGRADGKPDGAPTKSIAGHPGASDKKTEKAEMTGALQDDGSAAREKRKLDDGSAPSTAPATAPSTNGSSDKEAIEEIEAEHRPEKKAKVTDKITDKVSEIKDKLTGGLSSSGSSSATNGANGGAKKPGRPKKDKTAPPAVGRAQRKTRSQGPAEEAV